MQGKSNESKKKSFIADDDVPHETETPAVDVSVNEFTWHWLANSGWQYDMKGLAALLTNEGLFTRTYNWILTFDILVDAPSKTGNEKADEIQQILDSSVIKYSHQNDRLLRPSRIEEVAVKTALKVRQTILYTTSIIWPRFFQRRKRKKADFGGKDNSGRKRKALRRDKTPDIEWPPRRKHHQAPKSPQAQCVVFKRPSAPTKEIN